MYNHAVEIRSRLLTVSLHAVGGFCNFEERLESNRGEYAWPETEAGTLTLPCTFGGFLASESTAVRFCNDSLQDWEDPNLGTCFTEVTGDIQNIGEV